MLVPASICQSVCTSVTNFTWILFIRFFFMKFCIAKKIYIQKKVTETDFQKKFMFAPKSVKEAQKSPEMEFFASWKILSFLFAGNNLKLKSLLFFIFFCKPHIKENSGSLVTSQNAVIQSECRVLWLSISSEVMLE